MSQPDELFNSVNQFDPNQINLSLSLGLKKQLNLQSSLGLWLGRAQRSGSLSERFINFLPIGIDPYELIGNPNLKAEKNYQADLIFETHGDNTHLSINLFGSYLEDFISSQIDEALSPRMATAPGVRRFVNIPKAFKTGVEWSLDHPIGKQLYGQASMAYTYAHNQTNDEPLPEIAPLDFRYSVRGSFYDNKLTPSLSFRKVSDQNRVATSFGELNTPGFEVLDAAIEYQATKSLTLQAEVTNIFSENYYEHLSRSVSASVSPLFSIGRNLSTRLIYNF
jgi:iron complex outermembrane receptor protein